jgi:glycosyltransferase involved in cell wall biosynthesis
MRFLLDALVVNRGGHQTYFSNIIPQLGRVGKEHDFLLLYSPWQGNIFDFNLPPNFKRIVAGPNTRSVLHRILWEQFSLPRLIHRERADVLFSPIPTTTFFSPIPLVIAVRNPNPFATLSGSSWRYLLRNWILRVVTQKIANRASHVIFVSNYSKKVAVKVAKLDAGKSHVIYHGVGTNFINSNRVSRKSFGISNPYILTVSTIQTHKNYPRLLEAFARLCENPDLKYDLAIAGAIAVQKEFEKMQYAIARNGIEKRVHYLGEAPYGDLPSLYAGATLFVLPSLLETFGHPLVEAMASGVPIVCSNAAAMPEICKDAAIYFDPYDVDEMANTTYTVLSDAALRDRLIENGKQRVKRFSWANSVEQMLDLFVSAGHVDDLTISKE